jgi:hypothetical protein
MEKKKSKSITIKVDGEFYEMIEKFINDFDKKLGVEISITKASKIISDKIKNAGGLVI